MNKNSAFVKIAVLLLLALAVLSGCGRLYQNAGDIQARDALEDLIGIQEDYHKKNGKFARNLIEIQEAGYKLDYHTGIVYLEIESANDAAWRAVALPAESTTARVFAFDTNKGGYYEMDDEEVSSYVLGSLNFIREQRSEMRARDSIGFVLMGIMTVFGFRTWWRNRVPGSGWIGWPFILSLPPLLLASLTLNHMDTEIALSKSLQVLLAGSLAVSFLCVLVTVKGWGKIEKSEQKISLSALAVCTFFMAVINLLVITHTFLNYEENPDPLEKYIKPPSLPPRT